RHVDHDPLALVHAQRPERGGEGVHLAVELAVAQLAYLPGLAGQADQGQLVAARGQVPVAGAVAAGGGAADDPAPERRVVVVEDALRLDLPVDRAGRLAPELFRLFHRAPVKVFVTHDGPLPEDGPSIDPARGGRRATLVE